MSRLESCPEIFLSRDLSKSLRNFPFLCPNDFSKLRIIDVRIEGQGNNKRYTETRKCSQCDYSAIGPASEIAISSFEKGIIGGFIY